MCIGKVPALGMSVRGEWNNVVGKSATRSLGLSVQRLRWDVSKNLVKECYAGFGILAEYQKQPCRTVLHGPWE